MRKWIATEKCCERDYLACSVDDVALVDNPTMFDILVEGALDSRIVGVDKVILDELNDEGRLAWLALMSMCVCVRH